MRLGFVILLIMNDKSKPFCSRQQVNQFHVFDQTAKSVREQRLGEEKTIRESDHQIYNRVVNITVKGKRAKGNAILPYQAFCNGFLSFRQQTLYVLTCLHPFIHNQNSIEQKVEITSITFESFIYNGKLYCLDESPKLFEMYKNQIFSYQNAKKKQEKAFQQKRIELNEYSRIVSKVVSDDWVVLLVKRDGLQKNTNHKSANPQLKSQQMNFIVTGGYEQDLQMVTWQQTNNVQFKNSKQTTTIDKTLKIKTHNQLSKHKFSYYTQPNAIIHALVSRLGSSGSPIFQEIQGKIKWVGMNLGTFCQQGIGLHFNKRFQQNYDQFIKKLVAQQKDIQKQSRKISDLPFVNEKIRPEEQNEYPFIVQIIVLAQNRDFKTEFVKLSNGILINSKYVLTFIHNIYEDTNCDFSRLKIKANGKKAKHQFQLILPDLKQKIRNYLFNRDRFLNLSRSCKNNQYINKVFLEMQNADILFLEIKQPLAIETPEIQTFNDGSKDDLFIYAYAHRISQGKRQLNISDFEIQMETVKVNLGKVPDRTYKQIVADSQNYVEQGSISCFKSGGALICKNQFEKPRIVGINLGKVYQKSIAIMFDEQFISRIQKQIAANIKKSDKIEEQQAFTQDSKNYIKIDKVQLFDTNPSIRIQKDKSSFKLSFRNQDNQKEHVFCSLLPAPQFNQKSKKLYLKISGGKLSNLQILSFQIGTKQQARKNNLLQLFSVNPRIKSLILPPQQGKVLCRILNNSKGNETAFEIEFYHKSNIQKIKRWFIQIFQQTQQIELGQNRQQQAIVRKKLPQNFMKTQQIYMFFFMKVRKETVITLSFKK